MALLFMDGFDAGDVDAKWVIGAVGSQTPSSDTRFGAGRSVEISGTTGSINKSFAPTDKFIFGMALKATGTTASTIFCSLYTEDGTLHVRFGLGAGGLTVWRGSTTIGTVGVAVVGDIYNRWRYFEAAVTIHDTAGTVVVRMDGVEVFNFTGDTKNAGTSTKLTGIGFARLSSSAIYDDFYLCDDTGTSNNGFLGDVRVQSLAPSGAGSTTQFNPNGSANNWDNVNEFPYSATDFNSSSTAGARDLYALSDLAAGTASVLAIQNNVVARKTDSGSRSVKNISRSAGTVYGGTAVALSATDTTVSTPRPTDPATGAAWTVAGVNALEAGAEVV